jgi:hypothetical protein
MTFVRPQDSRRREKAGRQQTGRCTEETGKRSPARATLSIDAYIHVS